MLFWGRGLNFEENSRRGFVGAAACPARRISYAEMARRKASPGGWCSAQRIRICMTAGGSHTATTLAQRQLRLMRSKRSIIAISWYDAVTFDLIRHGQWPVTPSPPGEGFFSVPSAPASIFTAQISQAGGRGMPPPLQNLAGRFPGSRRLHPLSRLWRQLPLHRGALLKVGETLLLFKHTPPVTLCSVTAPSWRGPRRRISPSVRPSRGLPAPFRGNSSYPGFSSTN